MCHALFICATPHSYVPRLIHMCHASFIRTCDNACVRATTHSYVPLQGFGSKPVVPTAFKCNSHATHTATHSATLTAPHCNTHCTTGCGGKPVVKTASHCNTLATHTATHRNTPKHTPQHRWWQQTCCAVCRTQRNSCATCTLWVTSRVWMHFSYCNTLQRAATRCNTHVEMAHTHVCMTGVSHVLDSCLTYECIRSCARLRTQISHIDAGGMRYDVLWVMSYDARVVMHVVCCVFYILCCVVRYELWCTRVWWLITHNTS